MHVVIDSVIRVGVKSSDDQFVQLSAMSDSSIGPIGRCGHAHAEACCWAHELDNV
jgi:hypothetical protein